MPRATYISVGLITVFYLFTSWAAISSYGVHNAQATAAANPSMFIFAANAKYVGGFTTDTMQILVVTSLFAAFLAFHCNTARYHLALSRDGLLPRALSRTHPRYGSPVMASAAQFGLLAAVVIGFTLVGQNPYLGMGTSLYGIVLMIINYITLTGSTATWVNSLPLLLPAAAVIGVVMAGRQPAHEPSDDDHAQIADPTQTAVTAPAGRASA